MAKTRVYAFTVRKRSTGEMGTYYLGAKSADAAEDVRWNEIHYVRSDYRDPRNPNFGNPLSDFECCGYVGPVKSCGWQDEARGFVSVAEEEAERRAAMPSVEHDPEMLKEFILRTGRSPKHGNVLKRNLLHPEFVFEIEPGTPSYMDPSCESYHTM
jgi:hypothetical protein